MRNQEFRYGWRYSEATRISFPIQYETDFMNVTVLRFLPVILIFTSGISNAQNSLPLHPHDRVVFIGNTFADNLRRHNYLETALIARFPEQQLTFRNLGWSGDTLSLQPRPLNFGSLDEHLTQVEADVIVACFGMNESYAGESGLENFQKQFELLLEHFSSQSYNGESAPRVILISPIAHEQSDLPVDTAAHNKHLKLYSSAMQEIAESRGLTCIDLFSPTLKQMQSHPSQKLTENGVHLNEYGYWAVSQMVLEQLNGQFPAWTIETECDANHDFANPYSIPVDRQDWPLSAVPTKTLASPELLKSQPLLKVTGLPAGEYRLLIEGNEIAKASGEAWSQGVVLSNTPDQRYVEQIRAAVMDKNETFYYRWRAHNSEYIFGRRTKPYGSVSFPPEMQEYDRLIRKKEQQVLSLSVPRNPTEWQLERVK